MNSLLFPTTIVDDFLNQPNQYVDLASSLEYLPSSDGAWPGVRTENLSELYPEMINNIIFKLMSLYYNFFKWDESIHWTSQSYFQKVDNIYDDGWVHCDLHSHLTSIIYLCDNGLGTSLCIPKNITTFSGLKNQQQKFESYKNPEKIATMKQFKEDNNSMFQKTISIDSRFNRLLVFESQNYHCADNFKNIKSNVERLTLIIFINNIVSNKFPIQRCKIN
jgi:galactitol-specific phosphotransferase system IIB component